VVAVDLDVPFVATFAALSGPSAWRREAAAGDGSHPAAGGYAELAEIVLKGGFLDWIR
jgi:lysophospholipase L1-like esterase